MDQNNKFPKEPSLYDGYTKADELRDTKQEQALRPEIQALINAEIVELVAMNDPSVREHKLRAMDNIDLFDLRMDKLAEFDQLPTIDFANTSERAVLLAQKADIAADLDVATKILAERGVIFEQPHTTINDTELQQRQAQRLSEFRELPPISALEIDEREPILVLKKVLAQDILELNTKLERRDLPPIELADTPPNAITQPLAKLSDNDLVARRTANIKQIGNQVPLRNLPATKREAQAKITNTLMAEITQIEKICKQRGISPVEASKQASRSLTINVMNPNQQISKTSKMTPIIYIGSAPWPDDKTLNHITSIPALARPDSGTMSLKQLTDDIQSKVNTRDAKTLFALNTIAVEALNHRTITIAGDGQAQAVATIISNQLKKRDHHVVIRQTERTPSKEHDTLDTGR